MKRCTSAFLGFLLYLLILVMPCRANAVSEVTMMVPPADPARPVLEKLRDDFNSTHTDVKFRIIWTDLSPKAYLLTAARALPDLIVLPDFALTNYDSELVDLGPYLAKDAERKPEQFYPEVLEACRYKGKQKMLPNLFNVPLLYYRPDLFKKAGIKPPDDTWTWKEYREAAKKLTQRDANGNTTMWGTSITTGWWVEWLSLIRQAGGDLLDDQGKLAIGKPATDEAVGLMHDLLWEDHSAPRSTEAPAGQFFSGKYAMHYGGHVMEWLSLRKEKPFEWDIAPLPAGPKGKSTGEFAVAGWGIWKDTKDKDAAWQVLSYLTSKEAGVRFCEAGLPPVRPDVAKVSFLAGKPGSRELLPQHREALVESLKFARSVPKIKFFSPLSLNIVTPMITAALKNPDRSGIKGLGQSIDLKSSGYLATLGEKPAANPIWFPVELLVLAGIGLVAWKTFGAKAVAANTSTEPGVDRNFFLFVIPWLVGISIFFVGPMVVSFYWSHTNYNIVDPTTYVGFAQYKALFTQEPYFWHSLRISFLYALLAVPVTLFAGLGAALLLNQKLPGMGIFRTLFYLPGILPVAASGIMWAFFLNPRWGLINKFLALFGIQGPGWLWDPKWALPSLAIIALWGFGGGMLIFLAGLKNIPASLYEAASLDGAGPVRQFFAVTLPMLSPVIFFNLTVGVIHALQIFDIAYVVGSVGPGLGEPDKSTYFYVLNLFEKSFINLQLGLGSAMAWVLFAIILALTGINFSLRKRWVFEGDNS